MNSGEMIEIKLTALRNGTLTAEMVIKWARLEGHTGNLSPFKRSEWPVSFIIIWIALRDERLAEVEWLHALASGGPRLDYVDSRDVAIYHQAKAVLWAALASGHIEAYAHFESGRAGNFIPALMWDQHLNFDRSDRIVGLERISPEGSIVYVHVIVARAHVLALWPGIAHRKSIFPAKLQSKLRNDAVPRKKPGPADTTLRNAVSAMLADIANGVDLEGMPAKQLIKYGGSINTAKKARKIALSESQFTSNSDDFDRK